MAGDLKSGWGTQLNGFTWDDGLYGGYSTYNNWAKVTPPSIAAKNLPWGFNSVNMNPLITQQHSAMTPINCFQTAGQSASTGIMPTSMSSSLGGCGTPCPYSTPTPPYMYRDQPSAAMSSSIASLRLRAKAHSPAFTSTYSTAGHDARSPPAVDNSNSFFPATTPSSADKFSCMNSVIS